MSNKSTSRKGPRYFRYPEGKRKCHLYLTGLAFQHLVDMAKENDVYPSEVCEQIIRAHIANTDTTNLLPSSSFPTENNGLAINRTNPTD